MYLKEGIMKIKYFKKRGQGKYQFIEGKFPDRYEKIAQKLIAKGYVITYETLLTEQISVAIEGDDGDVLICVGERNMIKKILDDAERKGLCE